MTPQAALTELLAHVGARKGATVLVSAEELGQWPAAAVAAMKSQGLLAKVRPAASAICPGCERECTMPVHTVPTGPLAPASFIVCDKRSDINRVPVSAARLAQWRCDAGLVRGQHVLPSQSRHLPQDRGHSRSSAQLLVGDVMRRSGAGRHRHRGTDEALVSGDHLQSLLPGVPLAQNHGQLDDLIRLGHPGGLGVGDREPHAGTH